MLKKIATLALSLTAITATAAYADPVPGSVVVARSGGSALLLWDASPVVAQAVTDHTADDQTMQHLETLALQVMHDKSGDLAHSATITVRVLYKKTGDVSPVYHIETFAGIEHVLDLTVPTSKLKSDYAQISAQLAQGKVAAPVKLDVTGKLPPQQ